MRLPPHLLLAMVWLMTTSCNSGTLNPVHGEQLEQVLRALTAE